MILGLKNTLGHYLQRQRRKNGMSNYEASKKVGISITDLKKIENGFILPNENIYKELISLFNADELCSHELYKSYCKIVAEKEKPIDYINKVSNSGFDGIYKNMMIHKNRVKPIDTNINSLFELLVEEVEELRVEIMAINQNDELIEYEANDVLVVAAMLKSVIKDKIDAK